MCRLNRGSIKRLAEEAIILMVMIKYINYDIVEEEEMMMMMMMKE